MASSVLHPPIESATHCSQMRRFEAVVESYGSRRSDRGKWGSLLSRQDVIPLRIPMRAEGLAGASGAPAGPRKVSEACS